MNPEEIWALASHEGQVRNIVGRLLREKKRVKITTVVAACNGLSMNLSQRRNLQRTIAAELKALGSTTKKHKGTTYYVVK